MTSGFIQVFHVRIIILVPRVFQDFEGTCSQSRFWTISHHENRESCNQQANPDTLNDCTHGHPSR